MCRAVRCRSCGLTTWAGCGSHVEQVLRTVPTDQRCRCEREPSARGGGWLSRLLRG